MRSNIPDSIRDSAQSLAPDAIVSLFQLTLADSTLIRFTPHKEIVWQTNTYSEIPCTLTQMELDAQGRANRPKFTFVNPGGIFTSAIQQGKMNNAELIRYRLLKADLDADLNYAITEKFYVSKVMSLNKDMCVTELRDVLDGHMFKLPARAYYPPEFPHVKLQ